MDAGFAKIGKSDCLDCRAADKDREISLLISGWQSIILEQCAGPDCGPSQTS